MVTRPEEVGIYGRFGEYVKNGIPGGGGDGLMYTRPNLLDNGALYFFQRPKTLWYYTTHANDDAQWYPSHFDRWQWQLKNGRLDASVQVDGVGWYDPDANGIDDLDDLDYRSTRMGRIGPYAAGSPTGKIKFRQIHRNALQMIQGGDFCLSFIVPPVAAADVVLKVYFVRKIYPWVDSISKQLIGTFTTSRFSSKAILHQANFTATDLSAGYWDNNDTAHLYGSSLEDSTYWGVEFELQDYYTIHVPITHIKLERGTGRTPFIYDTHEMLADWRRCCMYYQQSGGFQPTYNTDNNPTPDPSPPLYDNTETGWSMCQWLCSKDLSGGVPLEIMYPQAFPWGGFRGTGSSPITWPIVNSIDFHCYSSLDINAIDQLNVQSLGLNTVNSYEQNNFGVYEVNTASTNRPKSSKRVYFAWTADAEIYTEDQTMPSPY